MIHSVQRTIKGFGCILMVFAIVSTSYANVFFLDPVNGDINNPGTIDQPWSSLQEVIEANYISSNNYFPLPYDSVTSLLVPKNSNAPIVAGDTLMLLSGLHGEIFLRNYINDDFITILGSEDGGAIIEKIKLQACRYWRIENVEVSTEPYGYYLNDKLVFLESHGFQGPSSDIEVLGCKVYSSDLPWDVAQDWLDNASSAIHASGDRFIVNNNTITNVDHGIIMVGDHNHAEGNSIDNFSGDGMRPLGSHVTFIGNLIKNCYDVDDNHDDGIQCYTTNGLVVDSVRLIGNVIINTDDNERPLNGSLQGIGCFDGPYNNWEVVNNVISVNHWHGISLYEAHDSKIINNTVIDPTPDVTPGGSWIRINDNDDGTPSTNNIVANNVANAIVAPGFDLNNVVLNTYEEYDMNFTDYWAGDFSLISTSILIDAGDGQYSSLTDVEGKNRDLSPDIGAYEFIDPVATNESPAKIAWSTYPNPSAQIINVDIDCNGLSYELLNLSGVKIKAGTLNSEIDLNNVPDGVYFLKLLDENKSCFSEPVYKKILKSSD